MNFKIHRGTKEIGGSCVEVWTENTRIIIDFGMPLVEKGRKEFDFNRYRNLSKSELINIGVLPDIEGLYENGKNLIDGVIISHSHQDHFGLTSFINDDIQYYLGKATHDIIAINNLFTTQEIVFRNTNYFEKACDFEIGDFKITPYWADHSAFDAYSFLIESNGKSLFYSGDFRSHGRKAKAFYWFTHNAPKSVDYLLLEGTSISRGSKPFKTELEIESKLLEVFKQQGKINFIYTSSQNIDRITSIYRACKKAGKIFVVDVYVAKILKQLSKYARIPYPSESFKDVKVMFPFITSCRLKKTGKEKILYQFKKYKITKEEIGNQADKIVMLVRPSMQNDIEKINGIDGGNLIYSMWEGYLTKYSTARFIEFLEGKAFTVYKIHTSGHADLKTLKKMVTAINPKNIVPIHTFESSSYRQLFNCNIVQCSDGEEIRV